MPQRLRGAEVRALRSILDVTQPEFSLALGGKTAASTISRWETEAIGVGEDIEKIIRLLVCERLRHLAPGVLYEPVVLIALKLTDRKTRMAPMEFRRSTLKDGRSIEEVWTGPLALRVASAA